MPSHLRLFLAILGLLFLFSCSSSKSQNDSDILPDSDDSESIIDDEIDSEEDSDFIDDSDEKADQDEDADSESNDTDSDIEDPEEPDEEIFEKTEPINGYKRCYDKIPAGAYEGFFANPHIESSVKLGLGYDYYDDYEIKEEDLEKVQEITVYSQDLRGLEKLVNLKKIQISGENVYDFTPLSGLT
ncbi:hypothetical protein J6Y50_05850, partial [bacterium]|nr:hypothetical protein [bacterium]